MGKNLIQQARGKGGPTYRAASFRYAGEAKCHPLTAETVTGLVQDIIKCQGHLAPLAKVRYADGQECLLPAPEGIAVGDHVAVGGTESATGNTMKLADIPEGALVSNLEIIPGDGGKFCRTTGTAARIITKTATHAIVELPSKKQREFRLDCRATIGMIAGSGRTEKPFLKAGTKHWFKRARNKRWPNPSGAAQNAVDHPFGNKRTSRKGKQRATTHNAPPGKKVGKISPRRTGRQK
ncbi:50S ribosomal protein L2 [Candidatus Woesearchaeota archaeon]|nr:50S ribosomal protein L2 [Candidatus Woesearchaeota archaeon]